MNQDYAQELFEKAQVHFKNDNVDDALELFFDAADMGHCDAQYTLYELMRVMGATPEEKEEAYEEAIEWLKTASENDDLEEADYYFNICYNVGRHYFFKENNIELGIKYMEKAAELDDCEAQYLVAIFYKINRNNDESYRWLQRAAYNDEIEECMYEKDIYFELATNVNAMMMRDEYKEELLCKAANMNHVEAIVELALIAKYQRGDNDTYDEYLEDAMYLDEEKACKYLNVQERIYSSLYDAGTDFAR